MQTIGVSVAPSAATSLPVDGLVGLAEQPPPLRVADDHVLGASLLQHPGADLAGERPFALPVQVLARHADVRVPRRLRHGVQRGERRRDDDLDVVDVLDHAAELLDEHDRLVDGLVHLPVRGDERVRIALSSQQSALSSSLPTIGLMLES